MPALDGLSCIEHIRSASPQTRILLLTMHEDEQYIRLGFRLGARLGLAQVELVAASVFLFQTLFSCVWLKFCLFGPLEWGWRMLTYGKRLRLFRKTPVFPGRKAAPFNK